MTNKPAASTPRDDKARRTGVIGSLTVDIADTTWRMFIPTIGLLLIGRMIDNHFHSQPWIMLVGVAVGAFISAVLVKRQFERMRKEL